MNRIKLSDIKWLLVLLCLPFVSSCKDDLEAYEEAEITSVGAYHRYYTTEKDAFETMVKCQHHGSACLRIEDT